MCVSIRFPTTCSKRTKNRYTWVHIHTYTGERSHSHAYTIAISHADEHFYYHTISFLGSLHRTHYTQVFAVTLASAKHERKSLKRHWNRVNAFAAIYSTLTSGFPFDSFLLFSCCCYCLELLLLLLLCRDVFWANSNYVISIWSELGNGFRIYVTIYWCSILEMYSNFIRGIGDFLFSTNIHAGTCIHQYKHTSSSVHW